MSRHRDAVYDELLLLRWRRSAERAAVDELLRRWERRLLFYVRGLVDDEQDAWDVLQQSFLHVVRKLHTVREPAALPAWLYTVARNAAMAHRRSATAADGPVDDAVDVGALADAKDDGNDVFDMDDVAAVHAALGQLSVPHREALILLFLQDLSVEEIAQVLGVSPGTVKSRVYYAKRAMRAILERQGVGHG